MKVGDIVTRSHGWKPRFMPGIVADVQAETVKMDVEGMYSYDQTIFTVAWSDGTLTDEMREQLIGLEEALNESR